MGIADTDINFAVIPVSHSYGFSNLITPLIARGVPMVLSSDPMPRAILSDLERSSATVFPGMPVFYQAFCELREGSAARSPSPLRFGRSAVSFEVARRFREKFRHPIHSFYGSSECGGICYDRRRGSARRAGFVGEPMKGVSLELRSTRGGGRAESCARAKRGPPPVGVPWGYFPEPNERASLETVSSFPDDLLQKSGKDSASSGASPDVIDVAGKR